MIMRDQVEESQKEDPSAVVGITSLFGRDVATRADIG